MQLKKCNSILIFSALSTLVACSGGQGGAGGASGAKTPSYGDEMEAQFIDAPVKGLKVLTASGQNIQTGNEGKFSCKRGELVKFSLSGLDLGYAACGEKIFVQDLVSNTANYSWDQAAAVLQSFAVDKGTYLDLSNINQEQLDLSGVAYSGNPTLLDLQAALDSALSTGVYSNVPADERPATAVNSTNAATAANTSLATHINLPSQLEMVLAQLQVDGASSIVLNGELVAETTIPGVPDATCWQAFKARSSVQSAGENYAFKIDGAVAYDDESVILNNACIPDQEADGECETFASNRLPKEKIISDSKVDMIFSNTLFDSEFGADIRTNNVLSLDASIGSNVVNFSGFFESKFTVETDGPLKGQSLICKYKVSASKTVDTTEEDDGSDSMPLPEQGTYSGILSCPVDGDEPVLRLMKVIVNSSGAGATASIKIDIDDNSGTGTEGDLVTENGTFAFIQDPEDETKGRYTISKAVLDGNLEVEVVNDIVNGEGKALNVIFESIDESCEAYLQK